MDEGIHKALSFVIGDFPESAKVRENFILSDEHVQEPAHKDVVFIVRPEISVMRQIIYQRDNWEQQGKDVHILFVPRRT